MRTAVLDHPVRSLAAQARADRLARLARGPFDLLVIGGGITGAGVALDAASRGLSVALVEQADFGGGTSSRSTKLVHGGLRYLPLGDIRQVREDLAERERLLRNAPHLVRPLPFVLPLYAGARRPLGVKLPGVLNPVVPLGISAGLWAYDALSGAAFAGSARRDRASARPGPARRHRVLSAADAASLVPAMRYQGLRRAFLYHDAGTDDARLVVTVLRTAESHGAVALNYARAVSLLRTGDRVTGAEIVDVPTGETFTVPARTIVNAAGVWAEGVAALAGTPRFHVRRAKGTHLVVAAARLRLGRAALVLPETDDGRIAFVVPWQGAALIGTTDTEWAGPPDAPAAGADDLAYLLDHAARFLTVRLTSSDVIGAYAGLRPLVTTARGGSTARLSRRHEIIEGPAGFVTIVGGKLTTYRRMAEETVNHAAGRRASDPSPTRTLPLDGADGLFEMLPALRRRARDLGVPGGALRHLIHAYGTRTAGILDLIQERPPLGEALAPGQPHVAAEVVVGARDEMAQSVADALLRRLRLGHLLPDQGRALAPRIAELMAEILGWSAAAQAREVEAYERAAAEIAPPGVAAAPPETIRTTRT